MFLILFSVKLIYTCTERDRDREIERERERERGEKGKEENSEIVGRSHLTLSHLSFEMCELVVKPMRRHGELIKVGNNMRGCGTSCFRAANKSCIFINCIRAISKHNVITKFTEQLEIFFLLQFYFHIFTMKSGKRN